MGALRGKINMQKIGEIKAELQALQPEEYDAFLKNTRMIPETVSESF